MVFLGPAPKTVGWLRQPLKVSCLPPSLPFPSSVLPSCRPSVVTFAGVGWSASALETLQLSVHRLFSTLFLFDSPTAVVVRLPLSVPSVVRCHRYDFILLLGI